MNHVALVVSDVGTSLSFYTDVVGFQQVMRPNFDRLVDFAFIYEPKQLKIKLSPHFIHNLSNQYCLLGMEHGLQ